MRSHGGYTDEPSFAELYDLVPQYTDRADRGYYVELCRRGGGKVLELGCGTGRVLAKIVAGGMQAVGLDASPHMLERCRQRLARMPKEVRARARLVQADMTDFHLGETFHSIIIPFRPFQHLVTVADQLACLRCAAGHLAPGGTLAFDVFRPNLRRLSDPHAAEESEDVPEFELPDGRTMRRSSRLVRMHPAEQYNDVELIYYVSDKDGTTERLVQAFPFRYFFRYEVEHLLARAGFEVVELHGDFDGSPFGDDSPEMIFVATRAGA